MPTVKYLSSESAKLYETGTGTKILCELLWGDRVEVLTSKNAKGRVKVNVRGRKGGYVEATKLSDEALLELYFIDVGQGDGVLIVTPDRKHILIDGGYPRSAQPHGKSAADFVDWKFFKDYGLDKIELDAVISSHCDADHYGGLWDMLNPDETYELDCKEVLIKDFFHAGVSWWKTSTNSRFLGDTEDGYLIDLLEGKTSLRKVLQEDAPKKLQGNWAKFLKCVLNSGANIQRLSYRPEKEFSYLPDFGPDDNISIKILAPVEHTLNGAPALKDFGSDSQNTNGHSILLRVDYGSSRILLTGDLNKKSQRHLLDMLTGKRQELAADVVKSCHHGSDDCSFEFMENIQASATIISSGDDETHAHPRPNIVSTCGITGHKKIHNDELLTPLVYSTEIARSVKIGNPFKVNYDEYSHGGDVFDVQLSDENKTQVSYSRIASGGLKASTKVKSLSRLKIIDGIVYGLVNVRTDGQKILCATLNEGKSKWEISTFDSRF